VTDATQKLTHEVEKQMLDKNLFMICRRLNPNALSTLSTGYHIRNCREDELDIWKDMPFDDPEDAEKYRGYMSNYFSRVYAKKGRLFYERCIFVCDDQDRPIATAFIWKAYDAFNTIHWLKVVKGQEGRGAGRALLSVIMKALKAKDYPVYLHTQPDSYRAIKLYADFGFELLSDPIIGSRKNDIEACLPILEKYMTHIAFKKLTCTKAPKYFLRKLEEKQDNEF